MNMIKTRGIKTVLTGIFSFTIVMCSAQKQLLTYQDLQYVMQNNIPSISSFLQQKDYHLQPSFGDNETRFFTLFADIDYTDISVKANSRHTIVHLSTTDLAQVDLIQKALVNYPFKNSKGAKIYRVKDGAINTAALKEEEQQAKRNKLYTIELEN